jgi:hypothetical protein
LAPNASVKELACRYQAVAALPASHAENAAPRRVGKFRGQFQLGRLRALLARDVDEDRVVRLDHRIAVDRLAALERAARHGRHANDRPAAVERDPMVAAGNVVLIDLAARELGAAVGAIILQAVELAAGVAPQNEISSEHLEAMGLVALDLHRLRHRVPLAEDAHGEALLDLVFVDAAHVQYSIVAVRSVRSPPPCGQGADRVCRSHLFQFTGMPHPLPPFGRLIFATGWSGG